MYLIITSPAPKVKWIRLNRLEKRNALCQSLMVELCQAIDEFEESSDNVLVLSGDPDYFSSGMDLKEVFQDTASSMRREAKIGPLWERLSRCTKPTIASVSGIVFGAGFELALMCDVIIASDQSQLRFPELCVGTIPGLGGSVRLNHLAGPKVTSHMIFSTEPITAQRAYELGIISKCVPHELLIEETLSLAEKIASQSLPLLQKAKQAICASTQMTFALKAEKALFYSTFDLPDQKEKMQTFLEKRLK